MSKFTNRLVNESSPYLLQHAHNPVDWYPWGEEALEKAKTEDKPIIVSIGYAACHWCHVMERESFEDEETAAIMNQHFVNIKIDREERPDLDHIYMDAVQAIAGNGGWPLNVFLLPGGKPFYGGTYFPPKPLYNRPSWKDVLMGVHEAYKERKHELESQAENLTAHLVNANTFGRGKNQGVFTREDLLTTTNNILAQADSQWGGFGAAPKFPHTFTIQYLLRHYYFTKDQKALDHAMLSLDKMIAGGIYDHLGGGFARYSTDAEWLAPHFEKMLYDNALLIIVLAEAYQLTNKQLYKECIEETIAFTERELKSREGGYYSALDADSEGVEGKYYVWAKKEIEEILGDEAGLFCAYYDVTEKGNWEHVNILNTRVPFDEFVSTHQPDPVVFKSILEKNKAALLQARAKRIRPALDDKILLGWNALMNVALAKAYAATLNEGYLTAATDNVKFLEKNLTIDNRWYHTYKKNTARIPAFLDDLAYLIWSYIHLQEVTGDVSYLNKAKGVLEFVDSNFTDDERQMFYYTGKEQQDVILRKKEIYDSAIPSGNSIMAFNLRYLAKIFDKPEWDERANGMVHSLQQVIIKYPVSFSFWAQLAQDFVHGINEVAIVGPGADEMMKEVLPHYIPNRIFQISQTANEKFPLLSNRFPDKTVIYLCKDYVCNKPLLTKQELIASLARQ